MPEDQPTEKKVKYSVLIPKSQHKTLKQASLDREISMQVLVRRAVDKVLFELGTENHVPDQNEQTRWVASVGITARLNRILLVKSDAYEESVEDLVERAINNWIEDEAFGSREGMRNLQEAVLAGLGDSTQRGIAQGTGTRSTLDPHPSRIEEQTERLKLLIDRFEARLERERIQDVRSDRYVPAEKFAAMEAEAERLLKVVAGLQEQLRNSGEGDTGKKRTG